MHKLTSLFKVADYKVDYIFGLKYERTYVRVIPHEYVYSSTLYQFFHTADEDTI
jgi:hypothetical protein